MKRIFRHLHRGFWIIAATVLLLIAIFFTAARLSTPYLAKQRPRLEDWTSHFLQQPVQIETLKIGWENLTPVLRCENINILDDQKKTVLLKVKELDLGINLFTSLLTQKPQIKKIGISGATITAYQNNDGSIALDGVGTFGANKTNGKLKNLNDFMEWLLIAPQLTLKNIAIDWYGHNQTLIPIFVHEVRLRNHLFQNDLSGSATVMQAIPTQLNFLVKMHGGWFHQQNLTAKIYLKLQNVFLNQWLKNYSADNFNLTNGQGNFEIWGTWKNQNWQRLQSLFNVKNIVLEKASDGAPLKILTANGNILWHKKRHHLWKLTAQFHNLTFDQWGKIPGFSNLAGYLEAEPTEGFLKLNDKNVVLDDKHIFASALTLTKLVTVTNWQQTNEGWQINTDNMQLQTDRAITNTEISLLLPKNNGSPIINLSSHLQMQGKQQLDYLPVGILSPALVKWLGNSITAAKNIDSTVILRGTLHDFPYGHNNGTFIADSKLSGVDLNYKPGWPALNHINGRLIFNSRRMDMQVDSADLLNIPIQGLHAEIPIIEKNVPAILEINDVIKTDLSNGLAFVQQSPLANDTLRALNNMQGSGPFQLQLNLNIPLEHIAPPVSVNGKILLQNTNVIIPDKNLQLQNLKGELNFTHNSVFAQGLTGYLWNKPFKMDIKTIAQAMQIHMNYQDYGITLTPQKAAWLMQLSNVNVNGNILIPNDKTGIIQANFSRIYLQPDPSQNFDKITPAEVPAFNLTCNDFRYGLKQFGAVQLQLSHYNSTTDSINLKSTAPVLNLAANGYWQANGGQQQTHLTGAMTTNNLGAALTNLGFATSDINANQGQVDFNLSWQGAVYNPSIKNMQGSVKLQIQKGVISNIDSGTAMKMDIGRLLTLLSFQSLERRLKLDFSDLTTRGFSFDKITGDFQLQNGDANTQNTLIDSSVAQVNIQGRIGLAAKDYNVLVSVTPNVTSSLPMIVGLATVAGGPVGPIAGAATWVASKLLSPAVNKITTDTYRMTGPWSAPQITQVGSFWTGNKEH